MIRIFSSSLETSWTLKCYLTHWGRDKMAAISQTMLSNAFSWMKMSEFRLKFHWSLFIRIQLTIFQHWFRWWLGADQATSHYLNQWWLDYRCIYVSLGLNELICFNSEILLNSSPCNAKYMHQWILCQHCFRQWLVACMVPSHCLNQCFFIVNWTLRNTLQWNSNQDTKFFIHENAFENAVCEMAAILSRGDDLIN